MHFSNEARMSALSLDYAALGGNGMSGAAALCALLEVRIGQGNLQWSQIVPDIAWRFSCAA